MAYKKLGNFDDAYIKKTSASAYGQIQAAKSAWDTAKNAGDQAGMTAAHQAAENIRAAYGYSGGPDGSQYLPNSYASVRTQYQGAGSAAAQAYRLAAQQGAARLAAQRPQIQADYDDLARQAYINYMKEKRDLPETLGRLGLQGQGTAETTAAAQSADYQNNLLAGERARQNALLGLENQIQDVYLTGDLKSAQAQAQALLEMAQGYPDYLLSQQKLEQDAQLRQLQLQSQGENQQAQLLLSQQKQQESQTQNAFTRQLAAAKALAEYGDFSGYAALGFNADQIEQMRRAWLAKQQQK